MQEGGKSEEQMTLVSRSTASFQRHTSGRKAIRLINHWIYSTIRRRDTERCNNSIECRNTPMDTHTISNKPDDDRDTKDKRNKT